MYMFGDGVCPDLDLLRLFLMLLYGLGWKGGSFFPTREEIENPPDDGIYTTHISEESLYEELNHLFGDVLGRKDKLSCHSGKKTGYLFAVLRGVKDVATIMAAACHSSVITALLYLRDALAIAHINRIYNQKSHRLGPFRSPHCAGSESAVLSCQEGSQWQVPLDVLVQGFMDKRVGIPPGDPRKKDVRFVYEKVIAWVRPDKSHSQKLRESIEGWSVDRTDHIMACVNGLVVQAEETERKLAEAKAWSNVSRRFSEETQSLQSGILQGMPDTLTAVQLQRITSMINQQFDKLRHHLKVTGETRGLVAGTTPLYLDSVDSSASAAPVPVSASPVFSGTKRKDNRRGDRAFPHRDAFKKADKLGKVRFLLEHQDDIDKYGEFINQDRCWLNNLRAPLRCIRDHCGSNPANFLDLHGKLVKTNFNKNGECKQCTELKNEARGGPSVV